MGRSVSVVIPTRNASQMIGGCLASIVKSSPGPDEVIVVDSSSSDGTADIARSQGATVLQRESSVTRARLIGALASNCEFILNLDADQRVRPDSLDRALRTGAEIVALGERSQGRGVVAAANRLRNTRIHRANLIDESIASGEILPRFYRRERFLNAMKRIPAMIIDVRPSPYSEDALVRMEATRDGTAIAYIPDGIVHIEEPSMIHYGRKWFWNGVAAKAYRGTPYAKLVAMRAQSRLHGGLHLDSLPAFALRAPWFALGYYL